MSRLENILRIKAVATALQELVESVVFVGGATVSLYADREAEEVRPTDDVDILIELVSYKDYAAIEEKLREKGFANDMESKVICRYKIQGIIVDVMPTSEVPLGFSNRWYIPGFKSAIKHQLTDETEVRILAPEYFLATKLEAFKNRGKGDGRTSTDFEDIIFFLNNRSVIWDELANKTPPLSDYLKESLSELMQNKYIHEWIGCHLDYSDQERIDYILSSIQGFINSK